MRRLPEHIVRLPDGRYRLYSKKKGADGKRKNLGTFGTRKAAAKHEGEVDYFKGKESRLSEGLFDKVRAKLKKKGYSTPYADKVADLVKNKKKKKLMAKGRTDSQAWDDAGREK